jgi:signal transduction histidine kinase
MASRYVELMEVGGVTERVARLRTRVRRTDPWVIDSLLATAFVVLGVVGHLTASGRAGVDYRDPDTLSVLLVLGASVPYYFRRHAPLAVLLVSEVAVVVLTARQYETAAAPAILLVGVYTVAAWSRRRDRALAVVAMSIGLTVVAVVGIPGSNGADTAYPFITYVAAYLFGSTVRNRRLYSEELEARADALERDRDHEAQRAVAEERLRIAQELHDVVAHSMGVIAVQAGVGSHVLETDPEEAKRSLDAISHTSRSTLVEIRRLLGVLRDDTGAAYAPAPSLADLDRLVAEVEGVGLAVEVRTEGTRRELPPGVDFTAYRIVQEALTNVLKHAGQARATVTVGYEQPALTLEVADDGRGVNGNGAPGGHGVIGMRERVAVYGGSFDAGPRRGGGFRVAVRLPYGELA